MLYERRENGKFVPINSGGLPMMGNGGGSNFRNDPRGGGRSASYQNPQNYQRTYSDNQLTTSAFAVETDAQLHYGNVGDDDVGDMSGREPLIDSSVERENNRRGANERR